MKYFIKYSKSLTNNICRLSKFTCFTWFVVTRLSMSHVGSMRKAITRNTLVSTRIRFIIFTPVIIFILVWSTFHQQISCFFLFLQTQIKIWRDPSRLVNYSFQEKLMKWEDYLGLTVDWYVYQYGRIFFLVAYCL